MFEENHQKAFDYLMLLSKNCYALPERRGLDIEYAVNDALLLNKELTAHEIVVVKTRQRELLQRMMKADRARQR